MILSSPTNIKQSAAGAFYEAGSRKAKRREALRGFALLCLFALVVGLLLAWVQANIGICTVTAIAVFATFAIHDRKMRNPGGIPCLTWHSVSAKPDWLPWARNTSVSPATLDRQLSQLCRMGLEPLDTRDFIALRRAGADVPSNAVLLHFDDGYLDNLVAAEPLLRKHNMCATLFISLDFIAPDRELAQQMMLSKDGVLPEHHHGPWDGYLSWREIKALDQGRLSGVFDVQPHGVDHGRVPISDTVVDVLTEANWRKLAWMQWAKMPGDKHDWYVNDAPPVVPLGTPVPQSGSALAARAWDATHGLESEEAFAARVTADFEACHAAFQTQLGKRPEVFCWPQNLTTPVARQLAKTHGYHATTAGRGNNREGENPEIISRLHVGERYAGFANAWIDDLAFRASVRCFQGNTYWYLVLAPIHLVGKLCNKTLPKNQPQRGWADVRQAQ